LGVGVEEVLSEPQTYICGLNSEFEPNSVSLCVCVCFVCRLSQNS